MRFEERLPIRLVIRALLTLFLIVGLGLQAAFYQYGPTPLLFGLLLGVPLFLFICARLIFRRWVARAAGDLDTASLVGSRVKRRVESTFAAIRRARRRNRVRRVELAALEAAKHDGMLSPDGVRTAAEALFRLVHLAWRAGDPGRLATLLGPDLLAEWEQRRSERVANEPHEVVGDVRVEYVSFTTGERCDDPRVVVLIEAMLGRDTGDRREQQTGPGLRRLCQYWTLGVRDGLFTVLDIEERTEGEHHLAEPIGAPSAAAR